MQQDNPKPTLAPKPLPFEKEVFNDLKIDVSCEDQTDNNNVKNSKILDTVSIKVSATLPKLKPQIGNNVTIPGSNDKNKIDKNNIGKNNINHLKSLFSDQETSLDKWDANNNSNKMNNNEIHTMISSIKNNNNVIKFISNRDEKKINKICINDSTGQIFSPSLPIVKLKSGNSFSKISTQTSDNSKNNISNENSSSIISNKSENSPNREVNEKSSNSFSEDNMIKSNKNSPNINKLNNSITVNNNEQSTINDFKKQLSNKINKNNELLKDQNLSNCNINKTLPSKWKQTNLNNIVSNGQNKINKPLQNKIIVKELSDKENKNESKWINKNDYSKDFLFSKLNTGEILKNENEIMDITEKNKGVTSYVTEDFDKSRNKSDLKKPFLNKHNEATNLFETKSKLAGKKETEDKLNTKQEIDLKVKSTLDGNICEETKEPSIKTKNKLINAQKRNFEKINKNLLINDKEILIDVMNNINKKNEDENNNENSTNLSKKISNEILVNKDELIAVNNLDNGLIIENNTDHINKSDYDNNLNANGKKNYGKKYRLLPHPKSSDNPPRKPARLPEDQIKFCQFLQESFNEAIVEKKLFSSSNNLLGTFNFQLNEKAFITVYFNNRKCCESNEEYINGETSEEDIYDDGLSNTMNKPTYIVTTPTIAFNMPKNTMDKPANTVITPTIVVDKPTSVMNISTNDADSSDNSAEISNKSSLKKNSSSSSFLGNIFKRKEKKSKHNNSNETDQDKLYRTNKKNQKSQIKKDKNIRNIKTNLSVKTNSDEEEIYEDLDAINTPIISNTTSCTRQTSMLLEYTEEEENEKANINDEQEDIYDDAVATGNFIECIVQEELYQLLD